MIATVVEGHGEIEAVPILVQRVFNELLGAYIDYPPRPVRQPRGSLIKAGGVERAVGLAAESRGCSAILVLIDADDDCPRELGRELQKRAQEARPDLAVEVVLANREYEAWFLAAIVSLRGERSIRVDACVPDHLEEIRDAKGWLSDHMDTGRTYHAIDDQPALTDRFDLDQARRNSQSFRKLIAKLDRLNNALTQS